MTDRRAHTVHDCHFGWDRALKPVREVSSGASATFDVRDCSNGQLLRTSLATDILSIDFAHLNPLCGPVWIEGAEPGDVLKVTVGGFDPCGWGWTANVPGFGLLSDDFPDPAICHWNYDPSFKPCAFGKWGRVPLKPFPGTIGVALAEPGPHSVIPPRRVGGNLDIRDLSAGSELYLPVEVSGALFSVGDTHAAQGDGEVCGTAIESAMQLELTFEVLKNEPLRFPRFRTTGPVTRHLDEKGYDATTGIGPDLMQAARDAVRCMIDLLTRRHGMAAIDAYMLASVCGDLRISEIVDRPHWIVSLYFPRQVLE